MSNILYTFDISLAMQLLKIIEIMKHIVFNSILDIPNRVHCLALVIGNYYRVVDYTGKYLREWRKLPFSLSPEITPLPLNEQIGFIEYGVEYDDYEGANESTWI